MKIMKFEVDGNDLFNKAIWGLIVFILAYSARRFDQMAADIKSLNGSMIQVVANQSTDRKQLDDHEYRIRTLEKNPTHAPLRNR